MLDRVQTDSDSDSLLLFCSSFFEGVGFVLAVQVRPNPEPACFIPGKEEVAQLL